MLWLDAPFNLKMYLKKSLRFSSSSAQTKSDRRENYFATSRKSTWYSNKLFFT